MTAQITFNLFHTEDDRESVAATLSVINELTAASRWKLTQFQEALSKSNGSSHNPLLTFLARDNLDIIGYAIFSVAANEAHLVNIAIAPGYQRKGIGGRFFMFSLASLRQMKIEECWLEVRESNERACIFYKKTGFRVVQVRKNFYEEPQEDGLLMMARLEG